MRSFWTEWALYKANNRVLIRESRGQVERRRNTGEKGVWRRRQRLEGWVYNPGVPSIGDYLQNLGGKNGSDCPPETPEGGNAHWQLDVRLLVDFRTAREWISVSTSHQICGYILCSHRKLIQVPIVGWLKDPVAPCCLSFSWCGGEVQRQSFPKQASQEHNLPETRAEAFLAWPRKSH